MKILNGKAIADAILADLRNQIMDEDLTPGLGVVLVGSDEASKIYVNLKGKAAEKVGVSFRKIEMSNDASEEEVLEAIEELNNDPKIQGIIVQLPLPGHLDKLKIIQTIDPKKDVDGFHDENIKLFFEGEERFFPVFPKAILELIKSVPKVQPSEDRRLNLRRDAVIICNSQEFGRTMQVTLEKENIFAQYFFREDIHDNLDKIKNADILITACGEPDLIQGEMLKQGVIIIDGGISRIDEKVVGDIDPQSVEYLDGYLSPVPGGVGPVTIACLLHNVVEATKKSL